MSSPNSHELLSAFEVCGVRRVVNTRSMCGRGQRVHRCRCLPVFYATNMTRSALSLLLLKEITRVEGDESGEASPTSGDEGASSLGLTVGLHSLLADGSRWRWQTFPALLGGLGAILFSGGSRPGLLVPFQWWMASRVSCPKVTTPISRVRLLVAIRLRLVTGLGASVRARGATASTGLTHSRRIIRDAISSAIPAISVGS